MYEVLYKNRIVFSHFIVFTANITDLHDYRSHLNKYLKLTQIIVRYKYFILGVACTFLVNNNNLLCYIFFYRILHTMTLIQMHEKDFALFSNVIHVLNNK